MSRRVAWRRVVAALVIGVGIPLAELALDCRVRESEGCTWGRAYLPLSLGVGVVLFAPVAFGVLTLVAAAWRGRGR